MRPLVPACALAALAALVLTLAVAVPASATNEFDEPCDQDGLAHIPNLPEGVRRPYSVRKRSRTVNKGSDVTDETPKLPPGQRRFDAVLPDEEGHDVPAVQPARAQRRLAVEDAPSNEVLPEEVTDSPAAAPTRRRQTQTAGRRRQVPKKVITPKEPEEGENYPANHPGLAGFKRHNPKKDVVVDDYEAVRKYPTHQEYLVENDVIASTPADQLAVENVPEERQANAVTQDGAGDVPLGYQSKFPQRTFKSDAGNSGDVPRVKARKHNNRFQEHTTQAPQEAEEVTQPPRRTVNVNQERRRPAAYRQRVTEQPASDQSIEVTDEAVPATSSPVTRGRQRYREGQQVQGADQRRRPLRRRPTTTKVPLEEYNTVTAEVQTDATTPNYPPRRRLRPRPAQGDEAPQQLRRHRPTVVVEENFPVNAPDQKAAPRSEPPRRQSPQTVDLQEAKQISQSYDETTFRHRPVVVEENYPVNAPVQKAAPGSGLPRHQPSQIADPQAQQTIQGHDEATLRRRPQHRLRVQKEEVQSGDKQTTTTARGHGRRLPSGSESTDKNSQTVHVEVKHDGTAVDLRGKPTLVRAALKNAPAHEHPSPAVIQKIVKNTLRRLQPQIAEHEGDVGVDILVKIIEVDE